MNPSTALATVLVGELAAGGVGHIVLCPGSRSAPLAYAARRAEQDGLLRLHVRVDERSAGFVALGLAKETARPAAVVTTSGTAVANLHPAVLEADHAGVPLLVLSADRPHELRGSGANQTTDQVRIFGTATRWFAELAAPERRSGQVGDWRNQVVRALAAAWGRPAGDPGPVHLNVAFREPLVPDDADGPDGKGPADWPEPLTGDSGRTGIPARAADPGEALPLGPRTVLLAAAGAGPEARAGAEAYGWPLLAEAGSGARHGPNAVGPYRLLLDHPRLGGRIERVVVAGRPTLSRPVTALLARHDVEVVLITGLGRWPDPSRRAARLITRLAGPAGPRDDHGWLSGWQRGAAAAMAAIDAVLDEALRAGVLTGPLLAREVAAGIGPGQALVAGSSNSIRDLDLAARPAAGDAPPALLANRGVAGIDGTISTAAGIALRRAAAGEPLPVRALVGDLTFLHDAGGLLVGALEEVPQLQVVVADDGGGGIFGLLEQGAHARSAPDGRATFERLFGTPQRADLAALCAGYGAAYRRVQGPDSLVELRQHLLDPAAGTSVLHVPIDRAGARELAARLRAAALAAIG